MASKHVRIRDRSPQFVAEVQGKAMRAMKMMMITGKAHAAAITPQATSVLVNSAYDRAWSTGYKVHGVVGYTADYAAALHALKDKKHAGKPRPKNKGVYWGPAGQTEFLAKGFEEAKPLLYQIYRKEMKFP